MTDKIKRIIKQNSLIMYGIVIILLSLILLIFIVFVKNNKGNKLQPYSKEESGDLSKYAIEKQWIIDTWNVNTESFTYYFKNNLLDYSKYNTPLSNYIVMCFYGQDNSKFAFSFYNSPDFNPRIGSEILLQVVEDKENELKKWRSDKSPIATDKINNFENEFYYYIVDIGELNENNILNGTSISININASNYEETQKETNFKYLTKSRPGYIYLNDYGIKGEFIKNIIKKGYKNIKIDEDYIDANKLDKFYLYQKYYVIPREMYSEFSSLSNSEDKIKFINDNQLLDDSKKTKTKTVEVKVGYFSYDGANWLYHVKNEKDIKDLSNFVKSAGTTGSSLKPEGNPVSINSVLNYDGYCSMEQAKEFTEFVKQNIDKSPNLFA